MTGKDLLVGLGDISQKYYEEAEKETISKTQARKRLGRPVLIAAVIALTAMLVGCAVVYVLRLQDMSVGKETYTQTFDNEGKYLEEPVEKTRDILTLFGHSGDNIQKATKEWFDFLETYDTDRELTDNNPDHEKIANSYEYTYGCYTLEMADKVEEIAEKYGLRLLEEWLPFQAWQRDIFLEETGIGSLVLPDSGAEVTRLSGMFYPPYNFDVDIALAVDSLENELWVTVLYARKDYFPGDYLGGTDLSLYEQWDYTAPDGTALLLALNNKGYGYVIAELENAMMILYVDGNYSTSAYPTAEEVMAREELEAAASVFDYSIQPQVLDRGAVAVRLEESNKAHEAENAYVPETYGSFADYLTKMYTLPSEELMYTFYDLTGDGVEELLIGENGGYTYWVTLRDGEIVEQIVMRTYLCENGITESYSAHEIYESHIYTAPVSESVIDDIDTERTVLTVLKREKDQWTMGPSDYEQSPCSETEAQAFMDQYPRIEMNWKPLMNYSISETQTLGEYIAAKDIRVSQEELLKIYRNKLNSMKDMYYSHYRILDINGDGVDDLLLKGKNDALIGNTDFYWIALTYRYGRIVSFGSDFYLCEDGVLERVETRYHDIDAGVEKNGQEFLRYNGFEKKILDFVVYNKATASWFADWRDEEPISEEEANDILEKYPRIDQGMRPIAELLEGN